MTDKIWRSLVCVLLHRQSWFWFQYGPHHYDWSCTKCGRIWEEVDF